MSPRFPCVTPVMESFYSDILRAIITCWTKSHPEFCKTSRSSSAKIINKVDYFRKKAPPQMFDWIRNAPPIGKVCCKCGV